MPTATLPTPMPEIDPRFVYRFTKFNKKSKIYETHLGLTADGHIDYAYRCGMEKIITEIIEEKFVEGVDGSTTHWVSVKATVYIRGVTFTGMSCSNSRVVQEPGFELAVAETRAIKRAVAIACNITEKIINPGGETPTRDIVDLPIDEPKSHEEIPREITKSAEDVLTDSEQFEV